MTPEANLQRAAKDELKDHGAKVVVLHPVNGVGEPDLIACLNGWTVVVELKTPTGDQPTGSQLAKLAAWRRAGAIAESCRSIAEVRDLARRVLAMPAHDASPLQPRRVVTSAPTPTEEHR